MTINLYNSSGSDNLERGHSMISTKYKFRGNFSASAQTKLGVNFYVLGTNSVETIYLEPGYVNKDYILSFLCNRDVYTNGIVSGNRAGKIIVQNNRYATSLNLSINYEITYIDF